MIWTSQVARDIDQLTTTRYGLPSASLMEEAGLAVANFAKEIWKPWQSILIVAGAGNNGGDALVAARILSQDGFDPLVFDIRATDSQETPDRLENRRLYEALGKPCLRITDSADLAPHLGSDILLIDGLLGLGPKEPLRKGLLRDCLTVLGAAKAPTVLAIDLPSGLLADVWDGNEVLLAATHTITFGAPKPLHMMEPARASCGVLRVAPLAFHPAAVRSAESDSGIILVDDKDILPQESPWENLGHDAHKYTRGHILVIGGSPGKLGAPLLSAMAALRAGAGWVSVALLSEQNQPELPRSLTYEQFADSAQMLRFIEERRVKAVVIGPGTMENPLQPESLCGLHQLQKDRGLFLVIDAGALKNWCTLAQGLRFDPERTLLTPHPGEWRGMGSSQQDLKDLARLNAAWDLCQTFGVSVFYKTATPFTVTTVAGRRLHLNHDGSRALGKAGSGDVLAGVAAALGCAGRSAALAGNEAQRAVARSARDAMVGWGPDGLGPEELIAGLGQALQKE